MFKDYIAAELCNAFEILLEGGQSDLKVNLTHFLLF